MNTDYPNEAQTKCKHNNVTNVNVTNVNVTNVNDYFNMLCENVSNKNKNNVLKL